MLDKVTEYISNLFQKQKILQLPQIAILLLSYYLLINSFYIALQSQVHFKVPKKFVKYNNDILQAIDTWYVVIFVLGLILFIVGFINSVLKYCPYLENYEVFQFSGIGVYIGGWAVAFSSLYYLYKISVSYFMVWYVLIIIVVALFISLKQKIYNRYNHRY